MKKSWSYNPSNPNIIPNDLKESLDKRGINHEDVRILVMTDMNLEMVRCDNYLVVTDSEIISISGINIVRKRLSAKFYDSKKIESRFSELPLVDSVNPVFPLAEYENFKVEELLSSSRLVAKNKKTGAIVLISNLSNTYKVNIHNFTKYLKELTEKGEFIPEKDNKGESDKICPKCGNMYVDAERKICPKCMDRGKVIRRTGVFFIKYKMKIFIILGMLVVSSGLGVLGPYISSGFFYDQVLDKAGEFYGQLLLVLGIIFFTRVFSVIINIFQNIITSKIAANLVYDLKKVIFSAIERLSLSFFTNRQTGGLMNQVTNDANTIYWFFCDGVPYFLMNIAQVIVVFIIMITMNPLLTLLSLITVPILAFAINIVFKQMEKLHSKSYSRSRSMNSVLSDVLSGMRVVKAFSKESDEISRFDNRSRALATADKKTGTFATMAFPSISFLLYLSNIAVWAIGGWMTIRGDMTYGILLTFVAYMNMIYSPMFFFVNMVSMAANSMNAMNRLLEVMDAKPDVEESKNPIALENIQGKVEFKNIEFSYEKNRKIIDGISFTIEPGKVIGIVGHTGAGKSTLANLLIRLYDVNNGEILIDDVNIKDISYESLRKNVSIVSQETYLFMGTILENIKYARPDATNEELIDAAKIAGAHDFIMKLPNGYSTKIGFGFKDLSGGERQRISIARAILRNPKILIMDEATAAMDTETERKIQAALERLTVGRTTIMIAHRLSTLRDADKLIVVENGKMPEFGTHLELINKKGIYYNLYKMQAQALKNIGIEA